MVSWDGICFWLQCCEDCWNDNKDLDYPKNSVDKAAGGFERIDSNLRRNSVVVHHCMLQRHHSWKTVSSAHFKELSHFKKWPQPPHPSATTTLISQQPSTPGKMLHLQKRWKKKKSQKKDYNSLKGQMMVSIFSNKVFWIKVCTLFFRHNAIVCLIGFSKCNFYVH